MAWPCKVFVIDEIIISLPSLGKVQVLMLVTVGIMIRVPRPCKNRDWSRLV